MTRTTIATGRGYADKGGHVGVEVESSPIEHVLDDNELARGPAEVLAAAIRNGIKTNPERTRDGKRQLFVRTGTLANGITTVQRGATVDIVAPPGYLQDPEMVERLAEVVLALREPLSSREVTEAIAKTEDLITKDGR